MKDVNISEMSKNMAPDLEAGEVQRILVNAYAETKAHPQREALASLFHTIGFFLVIATILLVVFVGWVMAR